MKVWRPCHPVLDHLSEILPTLQAVRWSNILILNIYNDYFPSNMRNIVTDHQVVLKIYFLKELCEMIRYQHMLGKQYMYVFFRDLHNL